MAQRREGIKKVQGSIIVRHPGCTLLWTRAMRTKVKYVVRSPKFIWAPCAQLYSLAETLQPPTPAFWAHLRGPIGQSR